LLRTTLYLTSYDDFTEINVIYRERLPKPYPARVTMQVAGLPLARIIHRTARNRPRPPNTWARNFIAKNFIKQPIRIVVSDINGLALIAHFS